MKTKHRGLATGNVHVQCLCSAMHLTNILKYFLGYRSRIRTPNPNLKTLTLSGAYLEGAPPPPIADAQEIFTLFK